MSQHEEETSPENGQKIDEEYEKKNNDKKTHRVWDFTINNPTDHDITIIKSWAVHCPVLVVTHEVGDKGTPHLQGRVHFKTARRFAAVKKEFPKAHWAYSRCPKHNSYPLKQGSNIIVNQDNRAPGTRNDIVNLMNMVRDKKTELQMWDECPNTMVRHWRGIDRYRNLVLATGKTTKYPHLRWPLLTEWDTTYIIWGPPGIGKTQWALAHFEKALVVTHIDDLRAFDRYTHDGIIFDDMSFTHYPRTTQIHLVEQEEDRSINIKYGTATIPKHTKKMFLTNETEGVIFDLTDGAIARRVTVIEKSRDDSDSEVGIGNTILSQPPPH